MKRVAIVGSGFSSLSVAAYLAKDGFEVDVFEKNDQLGGRARVFERDGFKFDMGPSWYWMPDVFERFFNDFGKTTEDFYQLEKLSPAYRVYFDDGSFVEIPDSPEKIYDVFEAIEPGSSKHLKAFLKEAEQNYEIAIKNLVYRPGERISELVTLDTIFNLKQFFTSIRQVIRKRFSNPKLIKILEFPVLFLGAKPQDTPAFYSFMNHADFGLGTFYPKGGMHEVVKGMVSLAEMMGVRFTVNANVEQIITAKGKVTGLKINGEEKLYDWVVSGADYHHTETLLAKKDRSYSPKYWENKTFAPSALLFYVAFDQKLVDIPHHTLFFDEDFDQHAVEIYDKPAWPKAPLFYTSFTSVTDSTVAPVGKETGFFLIPLAPGLKEEPEMHAHYFNVIMERFKKITGQDIGKSVIFKRSYSVSDFQKDYNSFKGNAYGMANTLLQTAFLRPKIKSKKVDGLFFTGQLTVPGPGVPPALISGKLAAELLIKEYQKEATYDQVI